MIFRAVDRGDVRVIERGEQLRLALQTAHVLRIVGNRRGQDLERDLAVEPGVGRAVDLTHAAGTERRDDLVDAQPSSIRETHGNGEFYPSS